LRRSEGEQKLEAIRPRSSFCLIPSDGITRTGVMSEVKILSVDGLHHLSK